MTDWQIIYSSWRALLFNIIAPVRLIFVNITEDESVMSVYSDRELSFEEKDVYYAVSGEIDGDFVAPDYRPLRVDFFVVNTTEGALPNKGILIFARCEYL